MKCLGKHKHFYLILSYLHMPHIHLELYNSSSIKCCTGECTYYPITDNLIGILRTLLELYNSHSLQQSNILLLGIVHLLHSNSEHNNHNNYHSHKINNYKCHYNLVLIMLDSMRCTVSKSLMSILAGTQGILEGHY